MKGVIRSCQQSEEIMDLPVAEESAGGMDDALHSSPRLRIIPLLQREQERENSPNPLSAHNFCKNQFSMNKTVSPQ